MIAAPSHVPRDRVVDIDIYAIPGMSQDYHEAWRALQQAYPSLIWTPRNEGHWIALGGAALAEVQSDFEHFSSRVIVLPKSIGEQLKLIPTTIDPPIHRPYRMLLNAAMSPLVVRQLEPNIRRVANSLIDGFIADGHCDFTTQFAGIFPIRIFLAMVGLPESDAPMIRLWAESMTRPDPPMSFADARQAFFDYLDPVVSARRAAPGDDMLSMMISADMDGCVLDHDEALSLCTQVLIAGVDTVVNFLGFAMAALAKDPVARQAFSDHPQGSRAAVNELFRRFGLVTIAREVVHDIEFHGVRLRSGEMIAIPTVVHGLDPLENDRPLDLDFKRHSTRHSTFGSGPHRCPGQELARAEAAITIEEWLRRIPDFTLADDADLTCNGGIVASISKVALRWVA